MVQPTRVDSMRTLEMSSSTACLSPERSDASHPSSIDLVHVPGNRRHDARLMSPKVRAQQTTPSPDDIKLGQVCPQNAGLTGCYLCGVNASPGGTGCTNGGGFNGYQAGSCEAGSKSDACSDSSKNCGTMKDCKTNAITGQCATIVLCINQNASVD